MSCDATLVLHDEHRKQTLSPLSPIEALSALHPQDSFVGLYRERAGTWEELGAVPVTQELGTQLALFAPELQTNCYFSINSLAPMHSRGYSNLGLPIYSRGKANLRWLTAAYCDFDCYGLTFQQSIVQFTAQLGCLPLPHLMSQSGRGLWALWLLTNCDIPGAPVPALPSTVDLLERINHALVENFCKLSPDPQCVEAARVMRLPGSVNPKSGETVTFFRWSTSGRLAFHELATLLGIKPQPTSFARTPNSKPVVIDKVLEAKRKAAAARWQRALQLFENLLRLRGGCFRQGTRRHAVLVFAELLKRNRVPPAKIIERALELPLSPPLPPRTIEGRVRDALNNHRPYYKSLSYEGMGRLLKISPAEKARLHPWFGPRISRAEKMTEHRRLVEQQLLVLGCRGYRREWPSVRLMAATVGFSRSTVQRIYTQLSFVPKPLLSSSLSPTPQQKFWDSSLELRFRSSKRRDRTKAQTKGEQ
jgi:hypothetical protein